MYIIYLSAQALRRKIDIYIEKCGYEQAQIAHVHSTRYAYVYVYVCVYM